MGSGHGKFNVPLQDTGLVFKKGDSKLRKKKIKTSFNEKIRILHHISLRISRDSFRSDIENI